MTATKISERNALIRLDFDSMTGGTGKLSARKACIRLAKQNGLSYRHIWRILKAMP